MYTSFQRVVASLIIVAMAFAPVRVYALPEDGTIVGGTGTINAPDAGNLTIDQTSAKLAIDWNSFSIGATESVHFNQDSASWLVLNRVTGGSESQILGRMSALGKIFIVNPNGVLFGAGATVDASGLVASTLNIDPANFMSGVYSFSGTGGSLVNNASLSLPGGYVALLGSNVVNNGTIVANLGTIALASGDAVTLELDAAGIISVAVDVATANNTSAAGIINTGKLTANGGTVILTAKNLGKILNESINNSGVIEANALESANGYVELTGNRDIASTGTISSGSTQTKWPVDVKSISIISTDGDVAIDGGTVSTTHVGSGLADILIKGKNITLDFATIVARSIGGEDNWAKVDVIGNNSVSILNKSSVLTQASGSVIDGAQVFIQGKDITIDNSNVTAEATGPSSLHAQIFLGQEPWGDNSTDNISILNGSTIKASVENGREGANADVKMDLTGTLLIENSVVNAVMNAVAGGSESAGSANAHIDLNVFGEGVGGVNLSNSNLTAQVNSDGDAEIYVQSKGSIDLVNSDISAVKGGTGEEEVELNAQGGSISADAGSLISADWVELKARDNIGTGNSPIRMETRNLAAYSYGTGNIYANNIGTELLNLGSAGHGDEDEGGEIVQANNGVVSVTTQGDMVVHNVIAENGGVFLETQNGNVYAGISRDGENGANVIAGGYSYISAPNGTIGVGNPGDTFDGISGQISGVVEPGETAVTGIAPAPGFDLRFGEPEGDVYYQQAPSEEGSAAIQSIWPTPGSLDSMNNPLKVNIQLKEGAPSAVPAGFTPASALTLRLGKAHSATQRSDPALVVNSLFKDNRAYYEILKGTRIFSFEPITPTGFYAYHPLSDLDASAFDGIDLETSAYEFIDGNLNYNGDMGSYYEEGKKK